MTPDPRDRLILALSEKLATASAHLSRVAEKKTMAADLADLARLVTATAGRFLAGTAAETLRVACQTLIHEVAALRADIDLVYHCPYCVGVVFAAGEACGWPTYAALESQVTALHSDLNTARADRNEALNAIAEVAKHREQLRDALDHMNGQLIATADRLRDALAREAGLQDLIRSLGARCAGQSELLAKRAEGISEPIEQCALLAEIAASRPWGSAWAACHAIAALIRERAEKPTAERCATTPATLGYPTRAEAVQMQRDAYTRWCGVARELTGG